VEAGAPWAWSRRLGRPVRVLHETRVGSDAGLVAWPAGASAVVSLPLSDLVPLDQAPAPTADEVRYRAAAARVSDALARGITQAPLEGRLLPLAHQLHALDRAMSAPRVRFLLADEVGLGKTIEAGLILRELKLRRKVRRTLVLAPKGLVAQWAQEMENRFGERFHLLLPEDLPALRRAAGNGNPWRLADQVICPMDAVKPLDRRRGWTRERIETHNAERVDALVAAGWDLVIIDEAHRVAGSHDDVARHRLADAVAQAAEHVLLLSATPHQGKTDGFLRLLGLLDRSFRNATVADAAHVASVVIRTEKRRAVDAEGRPLFRPRRTRLVPVRWSAGAQRELYEAVTGYAREGYNRAIRDRRTAVAFLMVLFQRLVTSSTRAIRSALERRLEVLDGGEDQVSLPWSDLVGAIDDPEADASDLLDQVLAVRATGAGAEREEVAVLLEAARRVEGQSPDAKALALLDLVREQGRAERNPGLKVLVFTEFLPTQAMLADFLSDRGFVVATLNGSMSLDERRMAQEAFAAGAQVLVSTEAGGEGLNLQFCHFIVNYDLPWNPMRIEQRIGRVDRIGQDHDVTAINLVIEDTVEHRVREVLEEKLATILAEFGVDKTADVLESVEAGAGFDRLYADVLAGQDAASRRVDELVRGVQDRAATLRQQVGLLGRSDDIDASAARKVLEHPLPVWVDTAVTSWLRWRGGEVAHRAEAGEVVLRLPEGSTLRGTFEPAAAARGGLELFSAHHPEVRAILDALSPVVSGQPAPTLLLVDLPEGVDGTFGLFRLAADPFRSAPGEAERLLAVFVDDDGRALGPTARRVWQGVVDGDFAVDSSSGAIEVAALLHAARVAAEEVWSALVQAAGVHPPSGLPFGTASSVVPVPRLEAVLVARVLSVRRP